MPIRLTLRLDFDQKRRLGHGKIALLEAIDREGSISAAGRQFAMSYRRAWLLVKELNGMFREPLVRTRGGGRDGGGAELTETGREVVARYRKAEAAAVRQSLDELAGIERLLRSEPETSDAG